MIRFNSLALIVFILAVSSDAIKVYPRYSAVPYEPHKCKVKSHGLTTIEHVQEAIDKAKDGDIIRLDPIVYTGNLTMKKINRKYITLVGDNQCYQNTVIRGQVAVRGTNWIINAIVFEKTTNAIDVNTSSGVRLANLVLNKIDGNGIQVDNSEEITIDNLVVDNVAKNAVDMSHANDVQVNNAVIGNVAGIGLKFDRCFNVELRNNVFRYVVHEAIKTSGQTNKVKIGQTVITGDSQRGDGWMSLEGNSYVVANTVATGSPKNGIVVDGCNYNFQSNICTNSGTGYCIYLSSKSWDCQHNIGFTNINAGGRGLYNAN